MCDFHLESIVIFATIITLRTRHVLALLFALLVGKLVVYICHALSASEMLAVAISHIAYV